MRRDRSFWARFLLIYVCHIDNVTNGKYASNEKKRKFCLTI